MSSRIYRGPLTDQMLVVLSTGLSGYGTGGIPVGDGVVPPNSGWDGEPNLPTSTFRPYLVLVSGAGTPAGGPVGDPQGDWHFSYLLASFSASRAGVDWMGDRARDVLTSMAQQTYQLGEDSYRVQQIWLNQIGGPTRNDATDPPFWSQNDTCTVWVSKA